MHPEFSYLLALEICKWIHGMCKIMYFFPFSLRRIKREEQKMIKLRAILIWFFIKAFKQAQQVSIQPPNYHQVNTNIQVKPPHLTLPPDFLTHNPVNNLLIISLITAPQLDNANQELTL